jgi:hypothetical protein
MHPNAGFGHTWFDKTRFTSGNSELNEGLNDRNHSLHRYGTEEFKAISDKLGQMDIPEGRKIDKANHREVNEFLGGTALDNNQLEDEIRQKTADRKKCY